ncbi:DUF2059 domain-containing protein [Novosphingobium sp.]|uniref:DUF2059 domain-containing protein n=1 Tax=Novosphingobium sp. TaxID=1874826 RepID=UPI003BAA0EA0
MLKSTRRTALAVCLAAACLASPLHAQQVDAPAATVTVVAVPAAEAATDPATAPIDPARLEAARQTVQYIFPAGTYARMMDRSLEGMVKPMMDSLGKLPLKDMAALAGVDEQVVATKPGATLDELMAIMDPAFKERTAATMPAMFKAMGSLFTEFEPVMQASLARAYARRFDARQLADLNAFFATPTGTVYAGNSMMIFTDPEVLGSMQTFMPTMMKRMPEIMKGVEAELARFPKRKSYKDLTPADRKRIAELLGIKEK